MSCLPVPDLSVNVTHWNDTEALDAYREAVHAGITQFKSMYGRAPLVLNVGAQAGLLALFALRAGAQHVVVVDANIEALSLAQRTLQTEQHTQFTLINKHSLQFSWPCKFDVVIADMFGPSLNDKGIAFYMHDLLQRQLVQRYDNKHFVIPAEGIMSVRLYDVPEASLDQRAVYKHLTLYTEPTEPGPTVVKWQSGPGAFYQPWSQWKALTPHVEVLHESYDREPIQSWPSHITLDPRDQINRAVLVQEWSIALSPTVTLRNVVTSPYVRRHAWGLLWCWLDATRASTWSVSVKNNGGVTLTAAPALAGTASTVVTRPPGKITSLVQNTFAKVALMQEPA